jgi:hypothetical protein
LKLEAYVSKGKQKKLTGRKKEEKEANAPA